MALALVRASCSSSARRAQRLLSTTSRPITQSPPIPSTFLARRSLNPLSQALTPLPTPNRFTAVRCHMSYPFSTLPGQDYKHWLVAMEKPGLEFATKQQLIDLYIKTLAKVVGSKEKAKKKIYSVSLGPKYYDFGFQIREKTVQKLQMLPRVRFVFPDSYLDPEYKDYGNELFVNGEIVQRSPERERRLEELGRSVEATARAAGIPIIE